MAKKQIEIDSLRAGIVALTADLACERERRLLAEGRYAGAHEEGSRFRAAAAQQEQRIAELMACVRAWRERAEIVENQLRVLKANIDIAEFKIAQQVWKTVVDLVKAGIPESGKVFEAFKNIETIAKRQIEGLDQQIDARCAKVES